VAQKNFGPALKSYFEAERRRRSHLEMKIEILQAISKSGSAAVRSRINHETMLPWKVVERELSLLQKQGLVKTDIDVNSQTHGDYYSEMSTDVARTVTLERKKRKRRYLLTERGETVLRNYTALQQSFASILLQEIVSDAQLPEEAAATEQTLVVSRKLKS